MQTPPITLNRVCPDGHREVVPADVLRQEHVLTTHMAVIEGWLGLLEDDALDTAQCRRAACVVRERTEALRRDVGILLQLVKDALEVTPPVTR